jgi:hypothetical protein
MPFLPFNLTNETGAESFGARLVMPRERPG